MAVAEAIDIALRAMLDPGDEVLIPQPSYVSYEPCTILADGVPVIIELKEENEFQPDKTGGSGCDYRQDKSADLTISKQSDRFSFAPVLIWRTSHRFVLSMIFMLLSDEIYS